jgi:adenylate cyclase
MVQISPKSHHEPGHDPVFRQAYLASQGKTSIRVRIEDNDRAWLTIKSSGAKVRRLEFEYEIPVIDAEALLHLRCGSVIEKERAVVPFEGFTWEVDTFHGANAGLVVAEIELNSERDAFPRPSWIGAEVTRLSRYQNSSLAMRPFSTWSKANSKAGT